MWRSRTIFAILILVSAIPLIAHNLISRNAVLSVPNDQVNFEIDADGRFVGIVNLTNCGTADAVVDGVRPSCGCTSVAISAEKVAPGAQLALKFAIDPKHTSDAVLRYDFANGLARLRTSCEIHGQFQNSDPQETAGIARVVAEGQYQLPFRISESELHLGDLAVADYEVSFRIRILGLNHSDTVIIREVFPGGIASVKPTGNEDDCCWLLELKVNPSQLRVRNSQKAVSKTSTIKLEVRSGSLPSMNFQLPIHYQILPQLVSTLRELF